MKIMKKNILFGVVCVALLTATSCSDFLDVQPEGDARDNAYFLNDQQAIKGGKTKRVNMWSA